MIIFGKAWAVAGLAIAASLQVASARPVHHRIPVQAWPAPGAAVFAATERAQTEPGVTRELAPDSKQTATGGPVGGVPGFSGGF